VPDIGVGPIKLLILRYYRSPPLETYAGISPGELQLFRLVGTCPISWNERFARIAGACCNLHYRSNCPCR
jgi:hypothetical protein